MKIFEPQTSTFWITILFIATTEIFVSADTCTIQGQVFQRGESVGSAFPVQCEFPENFPCFCNPDEYMQVECPYCTFPRKDEPLLCLKDGQVDTFFDLEGMQKTCSCFVSPATLDSPPIPMSDCTLSVQNPPNQNQANDLVVPVEDTCNFEGQVFARGESVGSAFEHRCGSSEEFPCFCNPNAYQQVDCPYCGFAMEGGGLLCLRDGEIETFTAIDGGEQTCGCAVMTGQEPTPDCLLSTSSANTCTIERPDGEVRTFSEGESLGDFISHICGPDFPCICNPAIPGQVECPFCRFDTEGGDVVCASDGEITSFVNLDGVGQTCVCEVPEDSIISEPAATCVDDTSSRSPSLPTRPPATDFPVARPTFAPVGSPTISTVDSPTVDSPTVDSPTVDSPTISTVESPTSGFDDPSGEGCTVTNSNGETVTIPNGESFGDLVEGGACGSAQEWPSFCNTDTPSTVTRQLDNENNVEYPYCVFDGTTTGVPACARDGEEATFMDSRVGMVMTCTCSYTSPGPGQGSCVPAEDTGLNDSSATQGRMVKATWSSVSLVIGLLYNML